MSAGDILVWSGCCGAREDWVIGSVWQLTEGRVSVGCAHEWELIRGRRWLSKLSLSRRVEKPGDIGYGRAGRAEVIDSFQLLEAADDMLWLWSSSLGKLDLVRRLASTVAQFGQRTGESVQQCSQEKVIVQVGWRRDVE